MTLFEIVTVAPRSKSAPGGTEIPPPAAKTFSSPTNAVDSGLEVVTAPVIVTPSIETVGSVSAKSVPIVRAGPPPLIVVAPAPAPRRARLFVIVTPPANVPRARTIVSPSDEASTAAWIVEKHFGPPTQRVAPFAAADAVATTSIDAIETTNESTSNRFIRASCRRVSGCLDS